MKKIFKSNKGNEKHRLCLLFVPLFFYDRRTEEPNKPERSLKKMFNVNKGR
jgi:hypothetical protein